MERAWESMTVDAVRDELESPLDGLSDEEAARRHADGANVVPSAKPPSVARILAHQFRSPLILILVAAGIFSALIGELVDSAFIAGVLLLNAVIATIQEWRAERGALALQQMLRIQATVLRDGRRRVVDAEQLVRGDVVLLEPGQSVPADLRLVVTQGLEMDESLLTGESTAVRKHTEPMPAAPLADRHCLAHAGSWVTQGRAQGVVVAIGAETQVGRIAADLVEGPRAEAPLLIRMKRFARTVGVVVLLAAVGLAAIGTLRGEPLREMGLFAVAVAVSAVPEGLPVALTVALAVGTARMARRHVIVRRLAAVEGLGSCTMIATDKTGTLTMNALTVREVRTPEAVFSVSGEGYTPEGEVLRGASPIAPGDHPALQELAEAVALCNEAVLQQRDGAWTWQGDPTDVALLAFAAKAGIDAESSNHQHPTVGTIPFEPALRYAATMHADGRVVVKGAPEAVLPMCQGAVDASPEMTQAGLRVLAVATGPTPSDGPPRGLRLLGFVGMMDPPRPGVPEAIDAARAAGMQIVMITGDHPQTAARIAHSVRIPVAADGVLTGADMEDMDQATLASRLDGVTVFARVAPHQKLLIVQAAQAAGHFVAVTGDGVNDAPALRAANVGVAMGRSGTDVAREAADIVIADDAFPSVVAGIEEGRIAYANVRNVVFLLISTGAAEVLLMLLALTTGSPLPLLPAQLLWLNLVTNGIQDVALGMEPGKGDEMERPPRAPRERIFDRMMVERTLLTALVMGGGGFAVFVFLLGRGWDESTARNALLLLMVLFENLHVGNSRSETRSAFALNPFRNPFLLWGVVVAQAIHLASMFAPPMQHVLETQPVSLSTWLWLLLVACSITVAFELHKAVRRRWPVAGASG